MTAVPPASRMLLLVKLIGLAPLKTTMPALRLTLLATAKAPPTWKLPAVKLRAPLLSAVGQRDGAGRGNQRAGARDVAGQGRDGRIGQVQRRRAGQGDAAGEVDIVGAADDGRRVGDVDGIGDVGERDRGVQGATGEGD